MSKITIPAQGASGRIEAQVMVKDAEGNIVPKEGASIKCSNVITNLGLAALKPAKEGILQLGALSNVVSIGTGSQAELETTTGLAIPARKATGTRTKLPLFRIPDYQGTGKPLAVQEYVVTLRFAPDGTARNYSEIGLGEPTAVQTYTLFKNSETLVPETLTVLGDEYLDLTYYYQVQGQQLSGFTFNADPSQKGDLSALGDYEDNQPLGPFPMSGEGVTLGTSAYVLLYSRVGGSRFHEKGGVYYFTAEDADKMALWNPQVMRPESEYHSSMLAGTTPSFWSVYANWTNLNMNNGNSGGTVGLRFPIEYRPRNMDVTFSSAGGKLAVAPGILTSSEELYIVGYGSTGTGGIIMFDKPITVTKDSRFEVTETVYPMWDSLPAVNSIFVSNPEG